MSNVLNYKGYTAKVEYDAAAAVLIGRVDGIDAVIDFFSMSAELIESEFKTAVDGYLNDCKVNGVPPQTPCEEANPSKKGTYYICRLDASPYNDSLLGRDMCVLRQASNLDIISDFIAELIQAGTAANDIVVMKREAFGVFVDVAFLEE